MAALPEVTATNKTNVFLGTLSHITNDGTIYILAALIPYYTQTLGMSYVEAGFAWTLLNLVGSLPQPLFGMAADKLKTFSLAGIGLIIATAALGPVGFTSNYAVILALAALSGIGTAICHPVTASFTGASAGKRRGVAMSFYSLGGNIGFTLAPLLLPPLILLMGPQASVIIVPIGLLVGVPQILASRGLKPTRPSQSPRSASGGRRAMPVLALTLIVAAALLRSWVYTGVLTFLPIYLVTRGFSLTAGGQLLSIMLTMGTLGTLSGGFSADRFSPKWGTVLSLTLAAVFLGLFFVTSELLSIVFLALAGFFLLWSLGVTIVMAQKLLPHNQSLASGLTIGLGIGLGGVGASVTGWMTDIFGIAISMGVLPFIALLAAIVLVPYREPRAEFRPEAQASVAGA